MSDNNRRLPLLRGSGTDVEGYAFKSIPEHRGRHGWGPGWLRPRDSSHIGCVNLIVRIPHFRYFNLYLQVFTSKNQVFFACLSPTQ